MKTKNTMILTTALLGLAWAAQAQDKEMTVVSWGGAYGKSQVEAYDKPFTEKTGIKVNMVDADDPATPLKAQVEAGNVSIDVADVEYSKAVQYCDEGVIVPIDPAMLPPAPDGTPATEDFLPGSLSDCAVASILWSTIYAYDASKYPDNPPTTLADFFDTAKFPGKRGLRKSAKANLEMALIADGVAPDQVYKTLGTAEGVDRAFKKLDTIKSDVVWWEAGAQPPQLLADGEVIMTTAYNGRIFNAAVAEDKPFTIVWDGQILDYDLFVIPKGAPHPKEAMDYIAFATSTQGLADQAKWISYGPARKSSIALIGKFNDGKTEMVPQMPTTEEHMKTALVNDFEFWADHGSELEERFNAWLAS